LVPNPAAAGGGHLLKKFSFANFVFIQYLPPALLN